VKIPKLLARSWGTQQRSWLRHYATSQKVVGSILDGVDFFNLPNSSSCTMGLGLTQPLKEMTTRILPGGAGKGRPARKADNLTTICEPSVYRKCGNLEVLQLYGPSRPVTEIALPLFY
jgi:hypothetical protein